MNARGVTHAAVMKDFVASRGAALESVFNIERQDRRKLFHRKRIIAAHPGDVRQQTASSRRHADAGHVRDHFN